MSRQEQKCIDSRCRVTQATGHTCKLGGALGPFRQPTGAQSILPTAPSHLELLSKEGWLQKILQPSAPSCSIWSKRFICSQQHITRCICAGEDTSIVQGEKVSGYFWLQQLTSLLPGNQPEVQNLRYKMYIELENQAVLHKVLNISQSFSKPMEFCSEYDMKRFRIKIFSGIVIALRISRPSFAKLIANQEWLFMIS